MDSGLIFRLIRIFCGVYCILCKPDLKIPLEFQWKQDFPPNSYLSKSTRHARIGKSTYYARLKYLEIDQGKDAEETYLNAEQMKLMEDLNKHIRELTGAVHCIEIAIKQRRNCKVSPHPSFSSIIKTYGSATIELSHQDGAVDLPPKLNRTNPYQSLPKVHFESHKCKDTPCNQDCTKFGHY